ncbi:Uncharacterised protein [BD1-7 clade bacterium]|uniref:Microcin J25-processing protein McjB C-terminal domain-containing protein n=1 Tax=BD1-7 clade bacterium TaxID=2029982 RepID=A0A5S9PU61_9GAMM|nr:Uncharacterised protein [BD1-7 clade bacterium]
MKKLRLTLRLLKDHNRFLLLEAIIWLGYARFLVRFAAYPKQTALLGTQWLKGDLPEQHCSADAMRISEAVQRTAKHLPWECKCLVQAMAAQSMLKQRNSAGTVYIGVSKTEGEYKAHAWLQLGDQFITGGNGFTHYQVIDRYTI